MTKNKNTPKLRFPEFTDEWEEKKLGEISTFLDNKRKPLKDQERNKMKGPYPYYGASGIIDYINDYIFNEELILLGEDGANIITRSTRLVFLASGKYWVNNHAHVIKAKNYISQYFLCELLEKIDYTFYNTGTAQPKLNKEVCKSIKLKIPSFEEQNKITDFISKIDKKIGLLEDKLHIFNDFKKFCMQQLFAQKLRFKNANNENYPNWEDMKMENLVEKYDKRVENPEDSSHILSSTLSGITLQKDYFDRQTASDNIVGYKFVPKGYFTYRSMSDTGIFRFNIQELIDNGIVSPAYPVFIEKRKIVNKYFLFYYLNYFPSIKKQILTLKEGGTRYALSFSKFNKFSVQLPVLDEQEKIANFLTNIDNKIEHITIEFKEMKLFKKGLLQQMFI